MGGSHCHGPFTAAIHFSLLFCVLILSPDFSAASSGHGAPDEEEEEQEQHELDDNQCRGNDGFGAEAVFNLPADGAVPGALSYSVVLFDDRGKVLRDGHYAATVTLRDQDGGALFAESNTFEVASGVASTLIGAGERLSGDDLAAALFENAGVITVEVRLDCAELPQSNYLATVPFSFLSEKAYSVADGSITLDSLDDALFADLVDEIVAQIDLSGIETRLDAVETTTASLATDMTSLNTTVTGLTTDITELDTEVTSLSAQVAGLDAEIDGKVNRSGDVMSGTLEIDGANFILNGGDIVMTDNATVDGVDVSVLDSRVGSAESAITVLDDTVAHLDEVYATDNQLALGLATKLDLGGGTVSGDLSVAGADLTLSPGFRLALDGDDNGTFLAEPFDAELAIAVNGTARSAFLGTGRTSFMSTGNTVAASYARFSDNALKDVLGNVNGQTALTAIQNGTLNGVIYRCNQTGVDNLEEDIHSQGQGQGAGQTDPVDFDVLCDDTTALHYGLIAQTIQADGNIMQPLVNDNSTASIVSAETLRTGNFLTVDYDQATVLALEAIDYLADQIPAGAPFVSEAGDNMVGNLSHHAGTDSLWFTDNGITLTAQIDGATGNAFFDGTLTVNDNATVNNATLSVTTTDNAVTVGNGAISISDNSGDLLLADGNIMMDGDFTLGGSVNMQPLQTVDGVDVSELAFTVAGLDSIFATDNALDNAVASLDSVDNALWQAIANLDNATTVTDIWVNETGDNMTGVLAMRDGQDVRWYGTDNVTETARVSGTTGGANFGGDVGVGGTLAMNTGNKLFFDNFNGEEYIYQPFPGRISFYTNNLDKLEILSTRVTVNNADFSLPSGKKSFFDGGATDHFIQDVPNQLSFWLNTSEGLRIAGSGIGLKTGNKLLFDNIGGNDYIYQPSSDTITISNETPTLELKPDRVVVGNNRDLVIQKETRFYLDGRDNTYITESSNNVIDFFAGDIKALTLTTDNVILTRGRKLYFNDVGDQDFIFQPFAGRISFYTNNLDKLEILSSRVVVSNADFSLPFGKKAYFDGGATDHFIQDVPNQLSFWFNTLEGLRIAGSGIGLKTGRQLFFGNIGGNDYIYQPSSDTITISNETPTLELKSDRVVVGNNRDFVLQKEMRLYLDGRDNTYITEPSNNVIAFTAGDANIVTMSALSGDDAVNVKGDITFTDGLCLSREDPNGNIKGCTVDGVDVSELEDRVVELERKIDDPPPPSDKPFAHGTYTSGGTCSGLNVSGNTFPDGCHFITPAPGSNYVVVATVVDEGTPFVFVSVVTRATNRFVLRGYNASLMQTSGFKATFVVFVQ